LSANQGIAEAQFMIGKLFGSSENNNHPDYESAVKWYSKASQQNHILASHNLGVIYLKGLGVEKNCVDAFKLFRKAAELGSSNDQFLVGLILLHSDCVDKNEDLAKEWLVKAAKQGNVDAKSKLKELDGATIIYIKP
jgi:TPR repeat protein